MKLYILRHGKANWPDWEGDDDLRPLTEKGKSELRRIAEFLKQIGVAPSIFSPVRCHARRKRRRLFTKKSAANYSQSHELSPGFEAHRLKVILKKQKDVMIVGHEPDLSEIIRYYTGARVKMSKAALARLDFDEER